MQNRCLVIGGNGFIGSHLTEALIHSGYKVKILDTFSNGNNNLKNILNDIEIIEGSFLNQNVITAALQEIDILFHYASLNTPISSAASPLYDIENNIMGTVKLFQTAVSANVKKIVYPSSGGTIYGDKFLHNFRETDCLLPYNPYAIGKMTVERYLDYFSRNSDMKYLVLRYANPYGERQNPTGTQGVISILLYKILKNEQPLIIGDGSAVRDYIYIKDAIEATLAVLKSETKESIFNVGSGQGITINHVIEFMSKVTLRRVNPIYKANDNVYLAKNILDITKIKKETGWMPKITLEDGIVNTFRWIEENFA